MPRDGIFDPTAQPVKMIVSVSKTEIIVWSVSQLEGTLQQPKARFALDSPTAAADLAAAVTEVATRRQHETQIIFQADGATSLQRVAELVAAIKPAYPDVVFSSDFE